MITVSIIKDICHNQEYCNNKCPFYDDEINTGSCLFSYDPCDWDIERIEKHFKKYYYDKLKEIMNKAVIIHDNNT